MKKSLKLWLKFRREHAKTPDGVAILIEDFTNEGNRARKLEKLKEYVQKRNSEGLIWKAKIYEQPGNREVYNWNLPFDQENPNGATS